MSRLSQVICPLMSTRNEIAYCDNRCAWYLASAERPFCAMHYIALFLSGMHANAEK